MSYVGPPRETRVTKARNERGKPRGRREPAVVKADSERLRRRAVFLRELAEAKELRARVAPRRSKVARLRQAVHMRSFRT